MPGLITTRSPGAKPVARDDDAGAVGAEDPRLRHRRETLADPDVEVVQRRGAELDQDLSGAWHRVGGVLVAEHLRARRPRGCGSPSRGTIFHMTAAELERLAAGARPRRRRRGAGVGVRGDRAAHPRAQERGALRRHAVHDGAARGVLPSRDAAAGRAHRRLRRALLLRAGAGAASRRGTAPALHVVRRATPCCASGSTSSAGGSAASTACSSTRTSTSTARPPHARASASTARTRC